eukprot:GHVN01107009.1.p1 GENE.GHVN01107009.1~~GHVN01107009.1.p1  ORF type:complete len:189 (+),score=78.41 GHVN01107009.1:194-760(+)
MLNDCFLCIYYMYSLALLTYSFASLTSPKLVSATSLTPHSPTSLTPHSATSHTPHSITSLGSHSQVNPHFIASIHTIHSSCRRGSTFALYSPHIIHTPHLLTSFTRPIHSHQSHASLTSFTHLIHTPIHSPHSHPPFAHLIHLPRSHSPFTNLIHTPHSPHSHAPLTHLIHTPIHSSLSRLTHRTCGV